jgi:hypothetical protein
MCHVEMAPLAVGQRCDLCIALAHIDKMGFAGSIRLPHRFKDLLIAAFDPHNRDACYLGHGARELAETSAEINNALSGVRAACARNRSLRRWFIAVSRCCSAGLVPWV